MTQVICELI